MYIYVTSTNNLMGQPTHTARMLYLGTNVRYAEKAVGEYENYQQENMPNQPLIYSALPHDTKREIIQFYQCGEWWYSIERLDVSELVKADGFQQGAFYSDKYLTKLFVGMRQLPPHEEGCRWFYEMDCNCILSRIDQDEIRRSF